jgi:ABC-type cobalamin transport system ATPase subunit
MGELLPWVLCRANTILFSNEDLHERLVQLQKMFLLVAGDVYDKDNTNNVLPPPLKEMLRDVLVCVAQTPSQYGLDILAAYFLK